MSDATNTTTLARVYTRNVYDFLEAMNIANPGKDRWSRKELLQIAKDIGYSSIPNSVLFNCDGTSRRENRNDYYFEELEPNSLILDNATVKEEKRGRPRKNPSLFPTGKTVVIKTADSD